MKIKDNIKHITHPLSVAEQNRLLHWLKENKDTLIINKDGNKEVNIEKIQELIEELLSSKEEIKGVTATIDNSTGIPFIVASLNEGILRLEFHNVKGEQGDTVILGAEEEYTLYSTTGNNTDGAMTQKATTKAIKDFIKTIDVAEDGFYFIDENYYIGVAITNNGLIGLKNVGYK